jgi:hypothetical protein
MVPRFRQFRKVPVHNATGNLPVPGDDVSALLNWDFDSIELLGLSFAA